MKRNRKGQFVPIEQKHEADANRYSQAIFELKKYQMEYEFESIVGMDIYGLYFKQYKLAAP